MGRIRIRNGTPNQSAPSLCVTCRCAQIMKGRGLDETVTLCHNRGNNGMQITMHIVECNDYEDKNTPALWELQKIAWRVTADKRNGAIGFLNPKQYREKFPDED